ncbi:hypothetical protein [Paraburkholderia sp. A3RO-2L]|jgi:hypothetical protein|uniref:hypothetical protein n=1 Tax=unclassified Paraburkholderia TaxID=2615204 RepID=UPI0032F8F7D7|nr:hypothetical protein [Burkholderia vietnamiensis]
MSKQLQPFNRPDVSVRFNRRFSVGGVLTEMMQRMDSDKGVASDAGRRFNAIMQEHGEILSSQLEMYSRSEVYSPLFVRFAENAEGPGKWLMDEVRCGGVAFGFDSIERITAELSSFSAASETPAVSAVFFPSPVPTKSPFILFAIFGDKDGNVAICVGVDQRYRWASLDFPPLDGLLERLIDLEYGLSAEFFPEASARLLKTLSERLGFELPEDASEIEAFFTDELRREMRDVGTMAIQSTDWVMNTLTSANEELEKKAQAELERVTQSKDSLYQKQIKKLKSQIDTAERLSKGSQDRATRLDAEVRTLRKQLGTSSANVQEAPKADEGCVGRALDALFA